VYVRVISANSEGDEDEMPTAAEPASDRWRFDQNILITSVSAFSSTALDVSWETTVGIPSTTLTLHYKPVSKDNADQLAFSKKVFQSQKASIDSKEYTLTDLKPYTEYEIFATVPHGLSGSVSNIRKGKTMDGAPTAPPTDVRVGVINNTAAYVRWSPPPLHLLNGELTGYKVRTLSFSFQ
jgi:roundabout, axon guidance receptor 2